MDQEHKANIGEVYATLHCTDLRPDKRRRANPLARCAAAMRVNKTIMPTLIRLPSNSGRATQPIREQAANIPAAQKA
jgi:hypothetical protein